MFIRVLSSIQEVLGLIIPLIREILVLIMLAACVQLISVFVESSWVGPIWMDPAKPPVKLPKLLGDVLGVFGRNRVGSSSPNTPAVDAMAHITIRVEDVIWQPHILKTVSVSLIHFS